MDDKLRQALVMGRELYAQKELARAEPFLAQLVEAAVPYADVHNMLGVIYHDAGQFSRAQGCFEEALRINPSYTEAALNLAVTYNDMGRYAEARDLYLSALTSSTRPGGKLDSFVMGKLANMYADIAAVFAASGAYDESAAELRRALGLRPAFIDIRLRLAQVLLDAARPAEALRELKAILAQSPDFRPARIHLALTLFSLGDIALSMQELEAVVASDPEDRRARLYLEMIRENQHRRHTNGGAAPTPPASLESETLMPRADGAGSLSGPTRISAVTTEDGG